MGRRRPRGRVELGVDRIAGVVLERARSVFGAVGDGELADLDAGGWARLNTGVDAIWARLGSVTRNPLPAFLIASTRPTMPATAEKLGSNTMTSLRRRVGMSTMTSPGGPLDLDCDAGGAVERERFLREVEAGAYGE